MPKVFLIGHTGSINRVRIKAAYYMQLKKHK